VSTNVKIDMVYNITIHKYEWMKELRIHVKQNIKISSTAINFFLIKKYMKNSTFRK
jgi:hypothetical protein